MPVQGGWTTWTSTSSCSSPCIDGTQNRARNCTRPTPEHGGENCIGNTTDVVSCGSNSCGNIPYMWNY